MEEVRAKHRQAALAICAPGLVRSSLRARGCQLCIQPRAELLTRGERAAKARRRGCAWLVAAAATTPATLCSSSGVADEVRCVFARFQLRSTLGSHLRIPEHGSLEVMLVLAVSKVMCFERATQVTGETRRTSMHQPGRLGLIGKGCQPLDQHLARPRHLLSQLGAQPSVLQLQALRGRDACIAAGLALA